jgi:hypothetical protein
MGEGEGGGEGKKEGIKPRSKLIDIYYIKFDVLCITPLLKQDI